jgi:glutamyl-tRNA synthetase
LPPSPWSLHGICAYAILDATMSSPVRTRFAPSPTGSPHVGVLRTALFSWLLARRHDGDFLLRIEDTDQNRLVSGALADILAALRALGLDYDAGPDRATVAALDKEKYGEVPGDLLPERSGEGDAVFQSQRLARYREIAERLVAEGKAYYAFDTPEELTARREASGKGDAWLYDRRDREIAGEEARARAARERHVVRFAMPTEGSIRTHDALRGVTEFDAAGQDDFICLKSDGFPTYHLASVVDDHDSGITHVLRGEEWISSAPKHFALYGALGWEPPVFVHVPSVLGPDGKKFSKRHGAKGVREYLDEGYLPEALFNYLALLGWSPGEELEILDRSEIIRRFDLDGISRSPAKFDLDKLTWMNGAYIRALPPDDLAARVLPLLAGAGLVPAAPDQATRTYVGRVLLLEQERLKRLDEAPQLTAFFFGDLPEYDQRAVDRRLRREGEAVARFLRDLRDVLEDIAPAAWEMPEAIETFTREVGASHGRERGDLTHPVRVAVTGREVGPGLFETMAVLGRERVLRRLDHAAGLAAPAAAGGTSVG